MPKSMPMWRVLGVSLDEACYWRMNVAFCPNSPQGGDWQTRNLLRKVLEDPKCQTKDCKLVVITHANRVFDYFNYTDVQFQLVRDYDRDALSVYLLRGREAVHPIGCAAITMYMWKT